MQRGDGQAKPQPRSLDRLPRCSGDSRLASRPQGLRQGPDAGGGEGVQPPCPPRTLAGDPTRGGLSALPSLLVREALATVWSERVTSPLSHPSVCLPF